MIGFVLFDAGSFQLIESQFLSNISDAIPKREKIATASENISKDTQNEITQILKFSSANSITFDEWTDKREKKYLGITIRSFIISDYSDYFLDLIRLASEINDSTVHSNEILKCLLHYQLNVHDVISCTTDNYSLIVKTTLNLGLWGIPCLCHVLYLISQTFVLKLKDKIKPIFELINSLKRKRNISCILQPFFGSGFQPFNSLSIIDKIRKFHLSISGSIIGVAHREYSFFRMEL